MFRIARVARRKRPQLGNSPHLETAPTIPPSTQLSSHRVLSPRSFSLDTPSSLPRDPFRLRTYTPHESSRRWHAPCSRPQPCPGKYSPNLPSSTRLLKGRAAALLVSPNDKRQSTNNTVQFPAMLLTPHCNF